MKLILRLAGAALALGALLFFTRMGPIFSVLPDDMSFPPATAVEIARLAVIAGPRWPLSHAMGLIAITLFILGYWGQAFALRAAGHRLIGMIAAGVATLAFGLFAVALVIDGFSLYQTALAAGIGGPGAPTLDEVDAVHQRALIFFTPAVFIMFIAMGVLSSRLLHGFIHSRWLGGFGMVIAIAGPTAYFFGITGPNWNNLQIGGSLMMLAFLWHFLIGVVSMCGRGVRS